jgi:hypothetical protein
MRLYHKADNSVKIRNYLAVALFAIASLVRKEREVVHFSDFARKYKTPPLFLRANRAMGKELLSLNIKLNPKKKTPQYKDSKNRFIFVI